MSVAVVFDSAGTLLNTYRVAKDICHGRLFPGIETTTLTFSSPDRVLIVLPFHSQDLMAVSPDMLLSEYLIQQNIGFGVSCTRKIVTAEDIGDVLYTDKRALAGDLQECIRNVWSVCRQEQMVTLNSGAIINMAHKAVEFTLSAGGWPFEGAKETITALHRMGVPTFIASGDRVTKLERMADHFGIPRDRVYGVATPTVKAQIIHDLRQEYDRVLMVGDGINDLAALRNADIAILTLQQPGDRPVELYKEADHVVKNVSEVTAIVRDLLKTRNGSGKICDRDDSDVSYKR